MSEKAILVDRGVDEVLIIGDEIIRVDRLSISQYTELLQSKGLLNIPLVGFDEYEKSDKYPKAKI